MISRLVSKFFIITLLPLILGSLVALIFFFYLSFDLPKIETLADYRPKIPYKIYSSDNTLLLKQGVENREEVKYKEIPQVIIDAVLSAEDDNFFNHSGIEYSGILRAFIANIKAGKVVQGGSTITQQVAKTFLLSNKRSYLRKIKDLILAKRIEEKFTKKEILFLYLNQVYFGSGYYGIKSAVDGYFGKPLKKISIAESALLAGLLVAPGKYSPYLNPKFAKKRQNYVLRRMYENNKISEREYKNAVSEEIKLKLKSKNNTKAPYFTDWIRQRLLDLFGKDHFYTSGHTIQTTLNWRLQEAAEKALEKGLRQIDKRQGFKGPLNTLTGQMELLNYEKEFRKKIFNESSGYILFHPDGRTTKEYQFDPDEYETIKKRHLLENENFFADYEIGMNEEDLLLKHLKLDVLYQAVVSKVDDNQRIIYVSLGGVKGIIPYDGFKWAHERHVEVEKNLFPFVTKPSMILNKGDVIWVSIQDKNVSLWDSIYQPALRKIRDKKRISRFKKQKFLNLMLEQVPEVQGAICAIEVATGKIISMVGGRDFKVSQFNRVVQSQRQLGSSIKPFLFAASLEKGKSANSIIIDSPEALAGVDNTLNWKPRNYDGKFKGPITLRTVLEESRNVPTIKLANEIGIDSILSYLKRIGFKGEIKSDLSITLGSVGASLLDVVKNYSIFPNRGKRLKLKSIAAIMDRNNQLYDMESQDKVKDSDILIDEDITDVKENEASPDVVLSKKERIIKSFSNFKDEDLVYDRRLAYIMVNLLKGVVYGPLGTARKAKYIGPYLAGKTGTTNNYVDAWFIGFNSKIIVGVWTGNDNNKTMGWGETGAKAALPIWINYMKSAMKYYDDEDFKTPKGILNVLINKDTGQIAKFNDQNKIMESFVHGLEPRDSNDLLRENLDGDMKSLSDDEYYNVE